MGGSYPSILSPPVFGSYHAPTCSELDPEVNEAIVQHPQSSGVYARLSCNGKLWLMDDSDASKSTRDSRQLPYTNATTLLCALTGDATVDDDVPVRPSLCWAPALGQNVVLACSDGCTIERWHAKRDFNKITCKAKFSPYSTTGNMLGSINSISCDSGGEYCMVSDELRVYMWKLDQLTGKHPPQIALDLTPADDDEPCELITSACFHPSECGTMVIVFDTGRVALFDISTTKHLREHSDLATQCQRTSSTKARAWLHDDGIISCCTSAGSSTTWSRTSCASSFERGSNRHR